MSIINIVAVLDRFANKNHEDGNELRNKHEQNTASEFILEVPPHFTFGFSRTRSIVGVCILV